MESVENTFVNDTCEKIDEQYETKNDKFVFDYDHMDNKSCDFEVNFNGNGAYSDDDGSTCHENDR